MLRKSFKRDHPWVPRYSDPQYWNDRTPLTLDMPRISNFYYNLNDNKIRKFLKVQKGRILDAGCGEGRLLPYADVGVDFSIGMLNRAKNARKNLIRASLLKIPLRSDTFSVAFSVDVLAHIEPHERKIAMAELKRVAERVYIFLAENRTVLYPIRDFLIKSPFRPKRLILYFAWIVAFPIDRVRSLQLD